MSKNLCKKQARYRAETVHLWIRLRPLELALNEKQIPQVIGKKEMEGSERVIILAKRAVYSGMVNRRIPVSTWNVKEHSVLGRMVGDSFEQSSCFQSGPRPLG